MKRGLQFGIAALVCSILLLAVRWYGRHTQPGDNDFDPVAAGVMVGSIALAAPAVVASLAALVLSLAAFARQETPHLAAVLTLSFVVLSVILIAAAWWIGA